MMVMMVLVIVEDGDYAKDRMVMATVVVVRVMVMMKIVMANVLSTHFVTVHQLFPYKERTVHWQVYIQWSWFSNDKPFDGGGEPSPYTPDRGLHTSSLRLQTLRQESTPGFLPLTSSVPGSASCELFINNLWEHHHIRNVWSCLGCKYHLPRWHKQTIITVSMDITFKVACQVWKYCFSVLRRSFL